LQFTLAQSSLPEPRIGIAAEHADNDPMARADTEDNFRKTVGQALGGAAVLIGAAAGCAAVSSGAAEAETAPLCLI
jgi:hypothetical protein